MDSFLIYFLLFFLGSSIASYLTLLLEHRKHPRPLFKERGEPVRSECDNCGKKLYWHQLVPVLSIIFLRFKSNCCNTKLSWKYLFGEIILGLWFVGCYLWFEIDFMSLIYNFGDTNLLVNVQFILSLVLGSIFFVLVMEDLDDMSVSSRYLYLMCAVSIFEVLFALATPLKGFDTTVGSAGDVVLGALWPLVTFLPFWLIYFLGKYLDKPMIGEADPYVFTALGIFFGTQFSISLFLYSVWLGAFLGIGYLYFINGKLERNIRIPFLPIIFLACLIILITNFHIIKIQDILIVNEILFKS